MQPEIMIYTSPTCAFCHQAKEYFKEKGLKFAESDITTDREALQFVLEEVGQAVTPIITINEAVVVGFDRPKIDELLEKAHQTEDKDFKRAA